VDVLLVVEILEVVNTLQELQLQQCCCCQVNAYLDNNNNSYLNQLVLVSYYNSAAVARSILT
jgi:hypothetical protein